MNTFTLTLIAAAAGSAAAFAPSQQGRASSAVEAKAFSDDFGAMAPVSLSLSLLSLLVLLSFI